MLTVTLIICALIPFYLIGAIPVGYLIARYHGIDIKTVGSGNVGATNVARALGKKAALATLCCDVAKGALAVVVAKLLTDNLNFQALAASTAVAGHCLSIPPWLKGGKGVATSLGALTIISWELASAALAVFILVFALCKIVSLASVLAAVSAALLALFNNFSEPQLYAIGTMALIVIIRHSANLRRLAEGKEKKFELKHSS